LIFDSLKNVLVTFLTLISGEFSEIETKIIFGY